MTVEERIGAAEKRKMEGNAYFKDEKLEEAMQQYEMVTDLWFPQIPIFWSHLFILFYLFLIFVMEVAVLWGFIYFYQAIAYMGDDFMFQLFGKYRDMALAVKNPCHLNMAACLIKLKRYEEAIGQCSIVCI